MINLKLDKNSLIKTSPNTYSATFLLSDIKYAKLFEDYIDKSNIVYIECMSLSMYYIDTSMMVIELVSKSENDEDHDFIFKDTIIPM